MWFNIINVYCHYDLKWFEAWFGKFDQWKNSDSQLSTNTFEYQLYKRLKAKKVL